MKQTKAPLITLPPQAQKSKLSKKKPKSSGMIFFASLIDMSWQLALVVLIPLIGGYELGRKLNQVALLTIIGFILAMVGSFLVIKKVYKEYSYYDENGGKN